MQYHWWLFLILFWDSILKTKPNAKIFSQAKSDVHLFYTGHSYKYGEWDIDLHSGDEERIKKYCRLVF